MLYSSRHSRESGNPENAGIDWIPAFAGLTTENGGKGPCPIDIKTFIPGRTLRDECLRHRPFPPCRGRIGWGVRWSVDYIYCSAPFQASDSP